jgi:hypothetical protein
LNCYQIANLLYLIAGCASMDSSDPISFVKNKLNNRVASQLELAQAEFELIILAQKCHSQLARISSFSMLAEFEFALAHSWLLTCSPI